MRLSITAACGAAMMATFAGTAIAHHSLAMFDTTKSMMLDGTLKSVEWTNPHSWFVLTAVAADGVVKDWNIEGPSPNGLIRHGWKHGDINAGDKVALTFHPRTDGAAGGMLVAVRLPDGRELALAADGPPSNKPPKK